MDWSHTIVGAQFAPLPPQERHAPPGTRTVSTHDTMGQEMPSSSSSSSSSSSAGHDAPDGDGDTPASPSSRRAAVDSSGLSFDIPTAPPPAPPIGIVASPRPPSSRSPSPLLSPLLFLFPSSLLLLRSQSKISSMS